MFCSAAYMSFAQLDSMTQALRLKLKNVWMKRRLRLNRKRIRLDYGTRPTRVYGIKSVR